ncbi:MAG: hypothetical protein Q7T74_04495 [Candidatus Saccharibacteria bacterium]|nr:hypothetical protein [Candidatus Saccharibacteria bacterium]
MAITETLSPQEQVDTASQLLLDRLQAAEHIELLSYGSGKEVIRCKEEDGQTFVVRKYNLDGFSEASPNSPPFSISLQRFNELFEEIGIETARHSVISVDEKSAVLIVEDLTNTIPVSEASTEIKIKLATSLGKLFNKDHEYRPGLQMIMSDMIVVDQSQGVDIPKFIDLDPYIIPNMEYAELDAAILQRMIPILWDEWCIRGEREEVLTAFEKSLAKNIFSDDTEPSAAMIMAFSTVNLMKSGIDPRH